MHGEDQYGDIRVEIRNLPRSFEAAHDGHGDVHNDGVRLQFACQMNGFLTVFSLGTDLPFRMGLQDAPYTLPHDLVIVGNYNPYRHASSTCFARGKLALQDS